MILLPSSRIKIIISLLLSSLLGVVVVISPSASEVTPSASGVTPSASFGRVVSHIDSIEVAVVHDAPTVRKDANNPRGPHDNNNNHNMLLSYDYFEFPSSEDVVAGNLIQDAFGEVIVDPNWEDMGVF